MFFLLRSRRIRISLKSLHRVVESFVDLKRVFVVVVFTVVVVVCVVGQVGVVGVDLRRRS